MLKLSLRECFLIILCFCIFINGYVSRRDLKRELIERRLSSIDYRERLETIESIEELGQRGTSLLVFAIGDPDIQVSKAADQALRRLHNNPGGFGSISQSDRDSRLRVTRRWIEWYLEST